MLCYVMSSVIQKHQLKKLRFSLPDFHLTNMSKSSADI